MPRAVVRFVVVDRGRSFGPRSPASRPSRTLLSVEVENLSLCRDRTAVVRDGPYTAGSVVDCAEELQVCACPRRAIVDFRLGPVAMWNLQDLLGEPRGRGDVIFKFANGEPNRHGSSGLGVWAIAGPCKWECGFPNGAMRIHWDRTLTGFGFLWRSFGLMVGLQRIDKASSPGHRSSLRSSLRLRLGLAQLPKVVASSSFPATPRTVNPSARAAVPSCRSWVRNWAIPSRWSATISALHR